MSPEAQRIAIAEACGWQCIHGETYRGENRDFTWDLCGMPTKHNLRRVLPEYLEDLNAMHEAEKVLHNEQFDRYRADLWRRVGNEDYAFESSAPLTCIRYFISATAAQRAEAFLRTIGKWQDS